MKYKSSSSKQEKENGENNENNNLLQPSNAKWLGTLPSITFSSPKCVRSRKLGVSGACGVSGVVGDCMLEVTLILTNWWAWAPALDELLSLFMFYLLSQFLSTRSREGHHERSFIFFFLFARLSVHQGSFFKIPCVSCCLSTDVGNRCTGRPLRIH